MLTEPEFQPQFYLDQDALDLGAGRAMTTNGDFVVGQSGSPAFGWWDDGPYVVAVVAAEHAGDNYCSGGSALPHMVKVARDSDP